MDLGSTSGIGSAPSEVFGPKANTHPIGKPQEAEALSECKRRVGVGELPEAPAAPWIQTFWITPAMLPRLPPEHNIHVFSTCFLIYCETPDTLVPYAPKALTNI